MGQSFTRDSVPDLSGKIAVVTGANSGIGYWTALVMAEKGAEVILLCRDATRGAEAMAAMKKACPEAKLELVLMDLMDLESVEAAAKAIDKRGKAIDILVNNAGIMMPPERWETKQGFEAQMGTNHLAHFALTGYLLPSLKRSNAPRVVNIASVGAWAGSFRAKPGLDFVVPKEQYGAQRCYGNSKLANLLFTMELAKRHPELTVTAAHPGGSATNLARHLPIKDTKAIEYLVNSSLTGALSTLKAATMPGLKSGEYFGPWCGLWGSPTASHAIMPGQAKDEELRAEFWQKSVEATKVHF